MNRLRIRKVIALGMESESLIKRVREDMIIQLHLRTTTDMRPGKWYKIRYEESQGKTHEGEIELMTELAYDEIPERAVVYKAPEEFLLPPEKSLRQKLKNCAKYLRHKSGERLEVER